MSDQHLVLFKLDGKPELAIAIEVEGAGFVISSGHRVEPYWTCALDLAIHPHLLAAMPGMPDDWPDFYRPVVERVAPAPVNGRKLLSTLNLLRPQEPIRRRV